ncbi:MAG: hypothetical protein PVI88_00200 [Nitrosopumilaceae archaeon]|jgi:hypothetical protein
MIVNWNKKGAGLLIISRLKSGKIVKTKQLLPGFNEIPDDDWESIKPQLQSKIDNGTIEIINEEVKQEIEVNGKVRTRRNSVTEFKDLPAEKALEIVKDTWDRKTLMKWKVKENRDEIRAAIAEQLEQINNPKKK